MTYGLYIGNESRPLETGDQKELRKLIRHLTPEQRKDGWTIAPVDPWPALALDLPRERRKHNPLWVLLGVLLLLSTVVILFNCIVS